ncbi:hypothetical protein P7C70_g5010, partial [Phenoliferia sp. Uapishka_3]
MGRSTDTHPVPSQRTLPNLLKFQLRSHDSTRWKFRKERFSIHRAFLSSFQTPRSIKLISQRFAPQDLVSSIDLILQDTSYPTELRHRTLQLALIIVTSINQGSVNAFFLRRDLFSTLVKFMSDPATSPFAFESALLLGILANFRKYEARNPYLVRIEDFVDEVVMRRIIGVVTAICTQTRQLYTSITDDEPPSFIASLTSLVYSLRLSELLTGGFSLSLPPAPSPSLKGKGKDNSPDALAPDQQPLLMESKEEMITPKKEMRDPFLSPENKGKDGEANGSGNANGNGKGKEKAEGSSSAVKKEESAFGQMPTEVVVILLPFYDLFNSNKAFCGLVFADTLDGNRELPVSTLRQPMLPYSSNRRLPIAAMLDTAVIYLRHNLHKRLDVETYIVCLRLVQRIMQQLKNERVRLDYDWVTLWRSILTLAGFIVSKLEELRSISNRVDDLVAQIFIVLSYAAYWGEAIFPSSTTSVLLHYELLHADVVLNSLSTLIRPRTLSTPSTPIHPHPKSPNVRDTPSRNSFFSSTASSIPQYSSATSALDCVTNILSIVSFFTTKVKELLEGTSEDETLEADQVMSLIENNLGKLDLVDSMAMGDLRRYTESGEHEGYFRAFSKTACGVRKVAEAQPRGDTTKLASGNLVYPVYPRCPILPPPRRTSAVNLVSTSTSKTSFQLTSLYPQTNPRMRSYSTFAFLLATSVLVSTAPTSPPSVEWVNCADHIPEPLQGLLPNSTLDSLPTTLKCGQLHVPVDYGKPYSKTNSIALGFTTYNPPDALGTIVFNPGGPGDEVASFGWQLALNTTDEFTGLEDFNFILMDVRGTYQSNQISCSAEAYDAIPVDFPISQSEFDSLQNASRTWAGTCVNENTPSDLIYHLSTKNVAKDFEALRVALSVGKVHFLGISYGTFYGAQWAADYPDGLDRILLDAVFGHGLSTLQLVGYGTLASNRELERVDTYCQYNSSCPFHSQGNGSVLAAYRQVLADLSETPMPASACINTTGPDACFSPVTARNFQDTIYEFHPYQALSGAPDYEDIYLGLELALQGDASYFARTEAYTIGANPVAPLLCSDISSRQDQTQDLTASTGWLARRVCSGWPAPGTNEVHLNFSTSYPIVWVTADYDVNCPTEWATDSFENTPGSYLIVRHGDVHGTFPRKPFSSERRKADQEGNFSVIDQPARALELAYLRNGELPESQDSTLVTVYVPGTTRGAIPSPYSAPQGELAGDD